MQATNKTASTKNPSAVAFKAVNNIFEKWGLSATQKMAVLRMQKATYYKYTANPESINLDKDQKARISHVLNMHASLGTIFKNRDNTYGFMKMENHNPFFNGRTPLSIIATGDFVGLYEVAKHVDNLRGAQW